MVTINVSEAKRNGRKPFDLLKTCLNSIKFVSGKVSVKQQAPDGFSTTATISSWMKGL